MKGHRTMATVLQRFKEMADKHDGNFYINRIDADATQWDLAGSFTHRCDGGPDWKVEVSHEDLWTAFNTMCGFVDAIKARPIADVLRTSGTRIFRYMDGVMREVGGSEPIKGGRL